MRLRDLDPAALVYLAGWKLVRHLPDKVAEKLFTLGADHASDHGYGMEMLRRNLTRVVGAENVTAELVRNSVRSYARYWREAFRLPAIMDDPELDARLMRGFVGREHLDASHRSGRGVVLALPHSGNWDMAGMFIVRHYGGVTTVAERLKPEVLYDAFVDYRESLGIEVLAHAGGKSPYPRLREVLESGGIVALVGERDLKRRGVKVNFFGEETTMPVGPARLAMDTGAALHVAHLWFTDDGWGLSVSEEICVDTLEDTVQRTADHFAANIAAHPTDWHMLQPLWPADVTNRGGG
ncbi:phosphatidylinositol mannoside acyltransferase [Corynebacterium comes]|uniref:Phosphatidylinositol mannoside acyltransferase n=1 Tax=Corynebacterium comes TaxID=2675218 RepID=A0A6B8VTQ5_9CORY|nr:phosphatidylinositol mannoside acyltransferase [Corynebacterium comes]QGU04754.1 Phosphatidylinositol mannoside acyltransferase [Corynebacterium comes]